MSSANQAKEIDRRLSNFWCLSEKRPFQLFGGILAVSAAILAFLIVVIFTHFRQHGQICSMSKSKHALKTTKRNVPFGWESMPFQFVILLV